MDCQTTKKNMKLNRIKNIGKVLFIIEGEVTEEYILYKIFTKIFNYSYKRIYRNGKTYEKYFSEENNDNKVFVINAEESNICFIDDDNKYLDNMFSNLLTNYGFDFENAAIYYVYDRDCNSNTNLDLIRKLTSKLVNSRDIMEEYNRQGLLLFSYPCIESYTASSFPDILGNAFDHEYDTGKKLKQFLHDSKVIQNNIDNNTLITAAEQLHNALMQIGINEYNLDNFGSTNTNIFDWQENYYSGKKVYRLISMLSLALLDLGLIEIESESECS